MHTLRLATCTDNFINWFHTLKYRVTQNLLDWAFLLLNVNYKVNCAPSGIAPFIFGKSRFGEPSKRTYTFRLLYLWLHMKKSNEEYFKLYSVPCTKWKSWKHVVIQDTMCELIINNNYVLWHNYKVQTVSVKRNRAILRRFISVVL